MTLIGVAVIGVCVGLLAGMFGKGGSAIATPLLHLIGIPAIVAVASPLPATIPSTATAAWAYWRESRIDWRLVRWSVAIGVPATVCGALATQWISGGSLVVATDVILVGLGLRFAFAPRKKPTHYSDPASDNTVVLVLVALVVGLASGLLANSGGFLLAPLYATVLDRPIKVAFGSSLAVASVLAVPGTIAHAALGHMDWTVVLVFGLASVPLARVGARIALKMNAERLERYYGAVLTILGVTFLLLR